MSISFVLFLNEDIFISNVFEGTQKKILQYKICACSLKSQKGEATRIKDIKKIEKNRVYKEIYFLLIFLKREIQLSRNFLLFLHIRS